MGEHDKNGMQVTLFKERRGGGDERRDKVWVDPGGRIRVGDEVPGTEPLFEVPKKTFA